MAPHSTDNGIGPEVQAHTFPNKIRLLTLPMRQTTTVTIAFIFGVGSRHETDEQAGISHMFEHMLFKGTAKFPTWRDVTEHIEGVGGMFNAFTASEVTGYWCKLPSEHIDRGLDVISDMVVAPNLKDADLKQEKQVVFEEIKIADDNPSHKTFNLLVTKLWEGHSLARPTAGTIETVDGITIADMRRFFENNYVASNLTIGVAGRIDPQEVHDKLWQKLAGVETGKRASINPFKQTVAGPTVVHEKRKLEQQRVALGILMPSAKSDSYAPLKLAAIALGGSMFSRLFAEIREKRGLAYDISANLMLLSDSGSLLIDFGVPPAKFEESVKVVIAELARLRDEGLSEKELAGTKELIRGRTMLRIENSRSLAEGFAVDMIIRDRLVTVEEELQSFANVTTADIGKVLQTHLRAKGLKLATVGPLKPGPTVMEHLKGLG